MSADSGKSKRPSMNDVALLAGVSQTTVSFILNDTPGTAIPQETRERVLAAVRTLDYRPNISARNLRTQSTNLIGYGFDAPEGVTSDPILDRFIYSAIRSLEAAGYHLLTFVAGKRQDVALYDELYRRGQVAGYVVANTNDNDPRIAYLIEQAIPFASFGRANDDWDFPWVDVDGVSGMRQVIDHLTGGGHHRIGLATWPTGSKAGSHREQGYEQGLNAAGIDVETRWVFRGENAIQTGAEALDHFLTLPDESRPTAIACVSDQIAAGVVNTAANRGLVIGRDLAVTGYDDSALAPFLHPPLTSVRQPIAAVGAATTELLLRQLRGEAPAESHILLKPELIVRSSG